MDAGIDSLGAIELGGILKRALPELQPPRMPAPAVLIFQLPTIKSIVEHILSLLSDFKVPTPTPPVAKKKRSKKTRMAKPARALNATPPANRDVAVVGMACRYPGVTKNLATPSHLWDFLMKAEIAPPNVPANRNWTETKDVFGSFLDDVEEFDASFFGISSAEARTMDPQQRLLLEVGYEAFFSCGYDKSKLKGLNAGCFVGIQGNPEFPSVSGALTGSGPYVCTGSIPSFGAGRISYCLGLTGPCMAIDTACASSLVATHTALRSIRNKECEMALVGGVSMIFSEKTNSNNLKAGFLSTDGCCCSFDNTATGYHRGEGCGALGLPPHLLYIHPGRRVLCSSSF
jgi:acyl transferase domain-containing protein